LLNQPGTTSSPPELSPTKNNQNQLTQIKSLTDLLNPELAILPQNNDIWYLGLDFGTLGLAAVLFKANTQQQYPLFWSLKNLDGLVNQQSRYPTLIYRDSVNDSFVLGGVELPLDTDIIIDNYKCYLDWSNTTEIELLQHFCELLPKLFLQLYTAITPELSPISIKQALGRLQGIIISFPSDGSDSYQFNLREGILQTHLIEESGEIFFLEEAIANVLGRYKDEQLLSGWTLVINGGNSTTEIALVNLPENWQQLTHADFKLITLGYGQRALEQDIFTEFIYPIYAEEIPKINSELPRPGKVEQLKRYQLDQYLQTYPFAYSFLEAARLINLMLEGQEVFNLSLGDYPCRVSRQDLQQVIINPFLTDLDEIINQLLTQVNIGSREIRQVIGGGGLILGSKNYLLTWLGQKFPQTIPIIDTEAQNSTRVARGLAYLPLFPQVFARSRHQYSDYFLLKELLKTIPQDLFTLEELMQKLATQGINTRVCLKRLLALLQGQFPSGLIGADFTGKKSLIVSAQKGYYRVNSQLSDYLKQTLSKILSETRQQVSEPLLINFIIPNEHS
jgi:hypothetical protein